MTCTVTPEDYARTLRQLLPPGPAWQFEDASTLQNLLLGMADTFNGLHTRSCDLLREVIAITTLEMLPDWERVCGLPDVCEPDSQTVEQRRNAVVQRLRTQGGQSPQFYIDLAAAFGFTITITEFHSAVAGGLAAGDPLTNDGDQTGDFGWQFVWQVTAESLEVSRFRSGLSAAGEPLAAWDTGVLQCILNKWKPAHTLIVFDYSTIIYT